MVLLTVNGLLQFMLYGLDTIHLWIVVSMAFALSGTLTIYSSCYIDEEDRGNLDPFIYKSVSSRR